MTRLRAGCSPRPGLPKRGAERQHEPVHRCRWLLYMRRTCAWRRGVSSARRRNPRVLCRTRTRRNAWRKPWSPPPLLRAAILLCHGVCLSKDATPTTEKKTSKARSLANKNQKMPLAAAAIRQAVQRLSRGCSTGVGCAAEAGLIPSAMITWQVNIALK